jgi:hypothetical protein
MLQTAMTQNGTRYFADPTTNAAGGTATFSGGQLTVDIPGNDSDTWSGYADLDWTRAGSWAVPTDWFSITNGLGAFVIGYQTPAAAVPTTGTATFSGLAEGTVFNAGLERDAIADRRHGVVYSRFRCTHGGRIGHRDGCGRCRLGHSDGDPPQLERLRLQLHDHDE